MENKTIEKEKQNMFNETTENQQIVQQNQFDEIVLYQDGAITIPVGRIGKEYWWTVPKIAKLYNIDRTVVLKHIKSIYEEGELDKNSTCAFFAQVQNEGGRTVTRNIVHYNTDMVVQIGFCVKSDRGIIFRERTRNLIKREISGEKEQVYIQQVPAYTEFEIFNFFSNLIYLPIKTLSKITEISARNLRYLCSTGKLESRYIHIKGKTKHPHYEIALSSLDLDIKKKIFEHLKTQNQISLLIDKAKNIQQMLLTGNSEAINSAKMLLSNNLILTNGKGWSNV